MCMSASIYELLQNTRRAEDNCMAVWYGWGKLIFLYVGCNSSLLVQHIKMVKYCSENKMYYFRIVSLFRERVFFSNIINANF